MVILAFGGRTFVVDRTIDRTTERSIERTIERTIDRNIHSNIGILLYIPMSSVIKTATNKTLVESPESYDISQYSNTELFEILQIPSTLDQKVIQDRIEVIVIEHNDANNGIDKTLVQFFSDIEQRLISEIESGNNMENTDVRADPIYSGIIHDQSTPETTMQSFNQYLANSKQRMNEIRPKTVQKIVNVDSRFRGNYYSTTSSDFVITLPYKINDVVSMRLAAYEIPASYYTISSELKNNRFQITNVIWAIGTGENKILESKYADDVLDILIPSGNYLAWYTDKWPGLILQNVVNTAIKHAFVEKYSGEAMINDTTGDPLSVNETVNKIIIDEFRLYYTCNRITGKSAFVANSGNADGSTFNTRIDSFDIRFAEIDDDFSVKDSGLELPFTLGWLMGFRLPEYSSQVLTAEDGNIGLNITYADDEPVVLSEGMCDLRGPKYAYIGVEDFNNNSHEHYLGAFSLGTIRSDVLARISTTTFEALVGSGISANSSDDISTTINNTRYYHGPVDVQQLRISLYDEFGRYLHLNEMDWSMTLAFDQLHDAGTLVYTAESIPFGA